VTGIITQGARDFGHIQYVAAYKVAYSDNGTSWTLYHDGQTNSTKVCGAGQGGQRRPGARGCRRGEGWDGDTGVPVVLTPSFPPLRSSMVTATTTRTRRTCSTCPSMPASSASCPWPGTTASPCAWSCWAATSRRPGRRTGLLFPAARPAPCLPLPAPALTSHPALRVPEVGRRPGGLPCPVLALGTQHCTLWGPCRWDAGTAPALSPH